MRKLASAEDVIVRPATLAVAVPALGGSAVALEEEDSLVLAVWAQRVLALQPNSLQPLPFPEAVLESDPPWPEYQISRLLRTLLPKWAKRLRLHCQIRRAVNEGQKREEPWDLVFA